MSDTIKLPPCPLCHGYRLNTFTHWVSLDDGMKEIQKVQCLGCHCEASVEAWQRRAFVPNGKPPPSIGQRIVAESPDWIFLAPAIDYALADAFQTGFEHAVAGGKEASRKFPQLADCMPLVLYFRTDEDRHEFIGLVGDALPGLTAYRMPEK